MAKGLLFRSALGRVRGIVAVTWIVCVASVSFAEPPQPVSRFEPTDVLLHPAVRAELALDQDQLAAVRDVARDLHEMIQQSLHAGQSYPEARPKLENLVRRRLAAILDPRQLQRFAGIMTQLNGPCLGLSDRRAQQQLSLTEAQQRQLIASCGRLFGAPGADAPDTPAGSMAPPPQLEPPPAGQRPTPPPPARTGAPGTPLPPDGPEGAALLCSRLADQDARQHVAEQSILETVLSPAQQRGYQEMLGKPLDFGCESR